MRLLFAPLPDFAAQQLQWGISLDLFFPYSEAYDHQKTADSSSLYTTSESIPSSDSSSDVVIWVFFFLWRYESLSVAVLITFSMVWSLEVFSSNTLFLLEPVIQTPARKTAWRRLRGQWYSTFLITFCFPGLSCILCCQEQYVSGESCAQRLQGFYYWFGWVSSEIKPSTSMAAASLRKNAFVTFVTAGFFLHVLLCTSRAYLKDSKY